MKIEEEEITKGDQDQELMMIKKELSKTHTIIEEEVNEVDIEEEETIIVSQESQEPNMMEKDLQDKTEVDTENKNNMMAKDLQDKTEEVIEVMAKGDMDREVEIEEEEDIKIEKLQKLIMLILRSDQSLIDLKIFHNSLFIFKKIYFF